MSITKGQVRGRIEELIGKAKEVAGKAIGDKNLEMKGNSQKKAGAVQASTGSTKPDFAKTVNTR
jgi:uncharacterized protein YjbJ (UPF0337 family)